MNNKKIYELSSKIKKLEDLNIFLKECDYIEFEAGENNMFTIGTGENEILTIVLENLVKANIEKMEELKTIITKLKE